VAIIFTPIVMASDAVVAKTTPLPRFRGHTIADLEAHSILPYSNHLSRPFMAWDEGYNNKESIPYREAAPFRARSFISTGE
jgi:hypothetical protein